jgi:hypothetical protein
VTGRMVPLPSETARTLDSARSGSSAASMRWKKSVTVVRVSRPPVRTSWWRHWCKFMGSCKPTYTHTHTPQSTT